MPHRLTRRGFIAAASALPVFAPAVVRAQPGTAQPGTAQPGTAQPTPDDSFARHNISAFRAERWQDHFDSLGKGAIVADTMSRALHFWSGDGQTYRLYPTSVPRSDELTKRGYTEVVRKKENPTWTPTASMHERFEDLPDVLPAGPDNPLGVRALYLSWPAYLIHGTHDTRKIGRPSSDGCIGLYNEMIAELFAITPIGTRVRII